MQGLVEKLFDSGELLVDLLSSALMAAKACLELPLHHLFVGC